MNIILVRDPHPDCMLGVIVLQGYIWQTLERPWIAGPPGGTKGVSCVPPGRYQLVKHDTEAHPRTFALFNAELGVYHYELPPGVQGRTACLIHVANWVSELRGCIALGMERMQNGEAWMLKQSKIAIDQFYSLVPWIDGNTLEIK